jgi:type I restriction enzyme M protein
MERAGLADALGTGQGIPLDVIFLAQAIHMLRYGGKLAFVVPDSTISGARYTVLRRLLIESHGLDRVVQLPRRAFRGTDAQDFVMFLAKGNQSKNLRLDRLDANGKWSTPIFVSPERGTERLDYEYHTDLILPAQFKSLHELGVEVTRGNPRMV